MATRRSPIRTFTLTPASDRLIEHLKPSYAGNASAVVNALLREAGTVRGHYDLLGLEPPVLPESPMRIELLVNGAPLALHGPHNGQMFVETPVSGEYTVRLTNLTAERVEAVLTVDGIDTITGKDGSHANRGWVVPARGCITVPGWFRSHAEAAAFTFQRRGTGESYAEKTGRGTVNQGVVGVALFSEKQRPAPSASIMRGWGGVSKGIDGERHSYSCDIGGRPAGSRSASGEVKTRGGLFPQGTPDVGTGYGRAVVAQSESVSFMRALPTPDSVHSVIYASREALLAMGVPLGTIRPNPFPAQGGVPAPAGWTGR